MRINISASLQKCLLWLLLGLLQSVVAVANQSGSEAGLLFIENKKQWPDKILFKSGIAGGNLFLEQDRFTFVFQDVKKLGEIIHGRSQDKEVKAHAYQVQFLGATMGMEVSKTGRSDTYHNYFIGSDPSKWASHVGLYQAVTYHNLYPNIDLVTYSSNGNFKYDFIVRPGADVTKIRMKYTGTSNLFLKKGELHVVTSLNHLIEQKPFAYQVINGEKIEIPCTFDIKSDEVFFKVKGKYDPAIPLVIDPELIFATHSGSTAPVFGQTATYDHQGNTYAAGPVYDVGYPATMGAFKRTFSGPRVSTGPGFPNNPTDVAISKYNHNGSSLLYATYFGGTGSDYPHSLIVNSKGQLLVMGSTSSTNLPTTPGSYDRNYNGNNDIFVTSFHPDGSGLVGSTYVGGSSVDGYLVDDLMFYYGDNYRGEIVLDSLDNCYIANYTYSDNFPVTAGAFQSQRNGAWMDGVVFKLNQDLTALTWSTYLGGSQDDAAFALTLDSLNQVYVVGATQSIDFPVTAGSLHPQYRGGFKDGFVVRISSDGRSLQRGTFLGTGGDDRAYLIQTDTRKNVYILGGTSGIYPVTPGKFNQARGSLFLQKMDPELQIAHWSTTVGFSANAPTYDVVNGTEGLSPTAFLVDNCGYIYFSGWGRTQNLPVTPDAVQPVSRRQDLYLAVLAPEANKLEYATFFGGTSSLNADEEHVDGGTSRFDKNGVIHQAVCTNAHNFPTTPNAVFPTNRVRNNFYDEVAIRLDLKIKKVVGNFLITPADSGEVPFKVDFKNQSTAPGTPIYHWVFGDSSTSNQANPTHTYTTPGTYTVMLIVQDTSICGGIDTVYQVIKAVPNDSTDIYNLSVCKGDSIQFPIPDTVQADWSPAAGLSNPLIPNPMASPAVNTTYISDIRYSNGAKTLAIVNVTVHQPINATFSYSECAYSGFSELQFQVPFQGQAFQWDFGDGSLGTEQTPLHMYKQEGEYLVKLNGIDLNGCNFSVEQPVRVTHLLVPNIVTPNKDGKNDLFVIKGLTPGTASLKIYNRWGAKIYESGQEGYLNNWDPQQVSDGVYYYYLQRDCSEKAIKGWLEVVR
ncbi:MAG: PKD domain-containing protein [Hymenobacteraceae bacterium]|nr:PKD domain-containing protein [Hymenobacteraceae bacterium]MDX5397930.1 PKD domain-containing protein [Hymenobacteraceae bacterium]MDX5444321.1 PKD domain-containing protein [Hymenobacteraceae bacterium]MDX5513999.1 PKD domain-containing protein [Hymenobacteraceae bacterium]